MPKPKSKQSNTRGAGGIDMNELAETLVEELGGMKEFSRTIASAVKGTNLQSKERMLVFIARLLQNAQPKLTGTSAMTDEEIDVAIQSDLIRHFVSMPKSEYRATIEQIEAARADIEDSEGSGEEGIVEADIEAEGDEEHHQDLPVSDTRDDSGSLQKADTVRPVVEAVEQPPKAKGKAKANREKLFVE